MSEGEFKKRIKQLQEKTEKYALFSEKERSGRDGVIYELHGWLDEAHKEFNDIPNKVIQHFSAPNFPSSIEAMRAYKVTLRDLWFLKWFGIKPSRSFSVKVSYAKRVKKNVFQGT